ncbi:hypothetical protein GKODMF_12575 [Candidatus Electrothrix gigas]
MQKKYRGDYQKTTIKLPKDYCQKLLSTSSGRYTGFFLSPLRVGIVICKYVRNF